MLGLRCAGRISEGASIRWRGGFRGRPSWIHARSAAGCHTFELKFPVAGGHTTLIPDAPNFVTHLECSMHGDRYAAGQLHNLSKAGNPLLVGYDLERLVRAVTKAQIADREPGMWRYREFLPVVHAANVV